MSTPDKTFLWSDRFSLRAQLAVGFVLVIALTLTVGFVALLGQGRSVSAVDKLLAVDGRIAELSMKSNAAMLKARRAEKDFLLFQSEFGFNEARSRYATLLRINLADISHYMAEIRALVGDPALVEQTRAIEQAIAQYETGFLKVVGTYGELGREDTGLEGRFRAKARSIESGVRSAKHHQLLTGLLTLRRHEKDFLLRGIDKYANAFAQEMDRFKADVASASLPKATREALLGLANEYSSLFEQYVKTGDRIDAEKSAYLTAAHTVEPLLDKLHFNATQSAIGTRNGAERAARTTSWMIIVASLSAALLGLTIAWLFSRNITRSVRETLDFAKGVAQGNLTTRLAPRGENEFGTLAVALNEMTEGLQQSRASLEARAADLAQSNRALQEEIGVRTRTEEALRGIDRARKVRVACNQVLIHATSEPEFLNDMCRTMVEAGGYGMAWIGYGGQSQTKPSLPVAVARANRGYVSTDELSCAEEEHRSGVTGTVHRTGKPMVLRNMPNDPRFGPLPERAFERGYTSALALPLQGDAGSELGNLSLYSIDPDAFDEAEQQLLRELANEIAYGITSLRVAAAGKHAEAALRLRNRAIESSVNAILITNFTRPGNPIEYINPAFERMTGYAAAETLGRNIDFLQGAEHDQPGIQEIRSAFNEQREGHAVLRNFRKDGRLFWNDLRIAPVRDDNGRVTHFVGVLNDITEARNYEQQLEYQANYDELTGLVNRNLLQDRLKQAIANAHRREHTFAVLSLNLDHFKSLNDALGQSVGDEMLKVVSERLRICLRDSDTVARVGGDEFVLVLPDQTEWEDVSPAARPRGDSVSSSGRIVETLEGILRAVSEAIEVADRKFIITCSLGISFYPHDGNDGETLLRNANAAMYRAKELGRNGFHFYTPELNAKVGEQVSLRSMLRHALERDEFVLYYQPKIDLSSGRISSVEALLRWKSAELGLIPPFKFIPILEETGMIVDVGRWVMTQAMADYRQWLAEGRAAPRIAVNVSPVQLSQTDFCATVQAVLDAAGTGGTGLDLEITESLIMTDIEANIAKLRAIRQMGISIAIDDFGTGYSSLSYLAKLPVDALKIDRAFIMNIANQSDDLAIVSSIISLAHSLKLNVVAEGVETAEQSSILKSTHCDEIQGYLISPPIPANQFWEWHERYSLGVKGLDKPGVLEA